MKVLLTGFSGTLGRAVARQLLDDGHQLRVLVHGAVLDPKKLGSKLDIIWGSLSQHDLFDQLTCDIDVVVHCAWEGRGAMDGMLEKVNLDGTVKLIESADRNKVKTFIHISSVAVYGLSRSLWGKILDEDQQFVSKGDSLNPYPWVKVLIEKRCQTLLAELTMNLIVVRPGLFFSDTKPPAKRLITAKNRRFALLVGCGKNHLPYIHVNDVANLILTLIRKPPKSATYNCVPTVQLVAREYLKKWAKYQRDPVRILTLPPLALRIIAWGTQRLKNALGQTSVSSSIGYQILTGIRDIRYSADKAVRELQWEDKQTRAVALVDSS